MAYTLTYITHTTTVYHTRLSTPNVTHAARRIPAYLNPQPTLPLDA